MNDNRSAIRQCVVQFVFLVEVQDMVPLERLEALPAILDHLASFMHLATYTFDNRKFTEPPPADFRETRALIAAHFPTLGPYNQANPITKKIGTASIMVGDGIDDLADIYDDLRATLWCWENTSEDDALWHFTNSFRSHWGLHLRSLQYYLHVVISGFD